MRKIILGISFACGLNTMYCQNLIPNPSFEEVNEIDNIYCRTYSDFNRKIDHWTSPTLSSPDIIHESYIDRMRMMGGKRARKGVVIKPLKPKTGSVIIGMKVYGCVPANAHCREYIHVKTLEKLKKGQCYEYSYFANPLTSGNRINNMGVAFSEIEVDQPYGEGVLNLGNRFGAKEIIKPGPGNWEEVKGIVKATGDWNYMVIGNFFHDSETKEIPSAANGYPWGYYLIDDVSLVQVSCKNGKSDLEQDDITTTFYFKTNSDALSNNQILELRAFFENVKDLNFKSIEIIGHADEDGDYSFNHDLSIRRANALAQLLVGYGYPMEDIIIAGHGELKPKSKDDKSENRRVEVKIAF